MHDARRLAIRLDGDKTVVLAVTLKQRNAIQRYAKESGLSVSAWVRHVAAAAAGGYSLELAAAFCGLPLSTWLREVAAAASGASPLKTQLSRARKMVRRERKAAKASRARASSPAGPAGGGPASTT